MSAKAVNSKKATSANVSNKKTSVSDTNKKSANTTANTNVTANKKKQTTKTTNANNAVKVEDNINAHVEENDKTKRTRKELSPDTVKTDLQELRDMIENEIKNIKKNPKGKGAGVKYLSSVNKKLKQLQLNTVRILKSKHKIKTNKPRTNTSGFMKPVYISPEMTAFTKWDVNVPYSRIDVTKFLCDYIKANNLQDPDDHRTIVCDTKLANLLKYNKDTAEKPLTYFSLQQYLKPHFPRTEKSVNLPTTSNNAVGVEVNDVEE